MTARTDHVLRELQKMAAAKYWLAREQADVCRSPYGNLMLGAMTAQAQLDAAALSKLVRVGLGIEEL